MTEGRVRLAERHRPPGWSRQPNALAALPRRRPAALASYLARLLATADLSTEDGSRLLRVVIDGLRP